MESKFKVGDAVVLNVPPGQQMRIESINADGSYRGIWVKVPNNQIMRSDYPESLLAPGIPISQRRKFAVFRSGL